MRRIVYIVLALLMIMPSLLMVYPAQAVTANLTVAGESGYTYGTTAYVGGAGNFTNMNSDDGFTSYVNYVDTLVTAERAWTMSTYTGGSTISSVSIYYKSAIPGAGATQKPFLRIGGVNYYGTQQVDNGNTFTLYSYTWYTNPATGLSWTTSGINNAFYGLAGAVGFDGFTYLNPSCTYYYVTVDYVLVPPTVTTSAATAVTNSTMTLNGSVDFLGGANVTSEGFVWDTTSHTLASTNVTPGNGYANWWYQNGSYVTGAFSKGLTGLTSGQTYYYRATANNTYGWNYGSELTVQTLGVPSVTTQPATDVATTSAQLNSLVTNYGGQLCDVRFGYGTTSRAATLAGFAGYDTTTTWVNNTYGTGSTPMVIPTTLVAGTLYYYNVQIENDAGIGYGVEGTFTTSSGLSAPTNLIAIPNSNSVTLVWTKGTGSAITVIKYSTSTYPNTTADGTPVYAGALSSTTHTNLTAGTTYFYSAWGSTGGLYSTAKATALGTTTAGTVSTNITLPVVTNSKWTVMPSELGLANLPIYDFGNWFADSYSLPRASFWLFAYLMLVMFMCMVVYTNSKSNNLLYTGLTAAAFIGFATVPTPPLIPIWAVLAFLIVLVVIGWVVNRY